MSQQVVLHLGICTENVNDVKEITIISKAQILKKPSALYKEHDESWLMYTYKNQINSFHRWLLLL